MFTFSKVFVFLVLIVLAQKVTQAQVPTIPTPPNPTDANTKYILADTRNFKFIPSTVNIHQSDFISIVADYSDNSWESFGYFVSQNKETCEEEGNAKGTVCVTVIIVFTQNNLHTVFTLSI
jgi:hypothetical protein